MLVLEHWCSSSTAVSAATVVTKEEKELAEPRSCAAEGPDGEAVQLCTNKCGRPVVRGARMCCPQCQGPKGPPTSSCLMGGPEPQRPPVTPKKETTKEVTFEESVETGAGWPASAGNTPSDGFATPSPGRTDDAEEADRQDQKDLDEQLSWWHEAQQSSRYRSERNWYANQLKKLETAQSEAIKTLRDELSEARQ